MFILILLLYTVSMLTMLTQIDVNVFSSRHELSTAVTSAFRSSSSSIWIFTGTLGATPHQNQRYKAYRAYSRCQYSHII